MSFISKEETFKILQENIIEMSDGEYGVHKDDLDAIMNRLVPTIEAEPIIRCKDCKHRPTGSGVNHDVVFPQGDFMCPCRCDDHWYSWMPDDDWFCANGERKEE